MNEPTTTYRLVAYMVGGIRHELDFATLGEAEDMLEEHWELIGGALKIKDTIGLMIKFTKYIRIKYKYLITLEIQVVGDNGKASPINTGKLGSNHGDNTKGTSAKGDNNEPSGYL